MLLFLFVPAFFVHAEKKLYKRPADPDYKWPEKVEEDLFYIHRFNIFWFLILLVFMSVCLDFTGVYTFVAYGLPCDPYIGYYKRDSK